MGEEEAGGIRFQNLGAILGKGRVGRVGRTDRQSKVRKSLWVTVEEQRQTDRRTDRVTGEHKESKAQRETEGTRERQRGPEGHGNC